MADDVTRPLPVTKVAFEPGLPHDSRPTITAGGQDWYLNPDTRITCDGVEPDTMGLISWLSLYPCEAVFATQAAEYHAVKLAQFASTHNRGDS